MEKEKELEDSYHKGINKEKKENAKKMKLKNISIEDIIDITGLSKEEIEKI